MSWQFTVLSTPILLAFVVSLLLFGYVVTFHRERRDDPVVVCYVWMTVATIVWTGFSALKLLHTDPGTKLLFYRLLHVGAATLPPLIFLFVVAFTDRTRWLRYEIVGAVLLVPVVFLLLLFFGPDGLIIAGTHLTGTDLVVLRVVDGPGFLLFSVHSTILVVAALALVLSEIRRFGPTYYPQAGLIAVAVAVPMLFSILTTAGVPPFGEEGVNLVPTSAAVSVVLFGVLLYRYRPVDLPPLAYATAMKYSPDVLFVLDPAGRIVSTNDHGRELLEVLHGSVGSSLSDCVPGPTCLTDPDSESHSRSGPDSDRYLERLSEGLLEIASSSNEVTYYRPFVEPLTRGGVRVGWVVVLRDETTQQRQQDRLQRKSEQLELFASTISHDLRNPLSVASGYLRLARDEYDGEELAKVESAHTRMAEIIENVLLLAKAGNQVHDLESVPVDATAEQAWDNVRTANAKLSVDVDRDAMADPALIHHVFENLFRNAVEHGGGNVTVTVGTLDGGLYVEDDGDGIPSDVRDDVFATGYTGTLDGTGFGLSIVEQIVTAHGWEIRATEGSEGGARFEVTDVNLDGQENPP